MNFVREIKSYLFTYVCLVGAVVLEGQARVAAGDYSPVWYLLGIATVNIVGYEILNYFRMKKIRENPIFWDEEWKPGEGTHFEDLEPPKWDRVERRKQVEDKPV